MKPKVALLLSTLRARGDAGLTSMEALHAGIGSRLAARVADLRAEGHPVDSELVRLATGQRVARYRLARRPYSGAQMPLPADTPASPAALPPSPGGADRDAGRALTAATGR